VCLGHDPIAHGRSSQRPADHRSQQRRASASPNPSSRLGIKAEPPCRRVRRIGGILCSGDVRHPLVRSAIYRSASPSSGERLTRHWRRRRCTADPDRRCMAFAQAAPGPDEEVAAELERCAERAQARGGLAAAAAFLERSAALTLDSGRGRGARCGGAGDGPIRAFMRRSGCWPPRKPALERPAARRAEVLHGTDPFASNRGSETPRCCPRLPKSFEPLDTDWRANYLEQCGLRCVVGRPASGTGLLGQRKRHVRHPRRRSRACGRSAARRMGDDAHAGQSGRDTDIEACREPLSEPVLSPRRNPLGCSSPAAPPLI